MATVRTFYSLTKFLFLICFSALLLVACNPKERERPFGDLRLGSITQLIADEMFLKDARLLLMRDARGWSIMSTLCTYDLSPLIPERRPEGVYWHSQYTKSHYDPQGNVLSGPSQAPLPRYKLYLEAGKYGGAPDTLYVLIGEKVTQDWRLALPATPSLRE